MSNMMFKNNNRDKSYQTIVIHDGQADGDNSPVMELDSSAFNGRPTKKVMVIAVMSCLFVVTFLAVPSSSSSLSSSNKVVTDATTTLDVPIEGMPETTSTRACVFDECMGSNCNPVGAPHLCLFHNGGPHGGCSPIPWSSETCDESCTVQNCGDLAVPDDVSPCDGRPCSKEFCQMTAGQLCGTTAPYQCTEGAARFGCTDDPYHWVLNECECCDATTCD